MGTFCTDAETLISRDPNAERSGRFSSRLFVPQCSYAIATPTKSMIISVLASSTPSEAVQTAAVFVRAASTHAIQSEMIEGSQKMCPTTGCVPADEEKFAGVLEVGHVERIYPYDARAMIQEQVAARHGARRFLVAQHLPKVSFLTLVIDGQDPLLSRAPAPSRSSSGLAAESYSRHDNSTPAPRRRGPSTSLTVNSRDGKFGPTEPFCRRARCVRAISPSAVMKTRARRALAKSRTAAPLVRRQARGPRLQRAAQAAPILGLLRFGQQDARMDGRHNGRRGLAGGPGVLAASDLVSSLDSESSSPEAGASETSESDSESNIRVPTSES